MTRPEYVRNHTNTNVVLQCEAMGLPTPSMAWIFTRADNQTFNLPGEHPPPPSTPLPPRPHHPLHGLDLHPGRQPDLQPAR